MRTQATYRIFGDGAALTATRVTEALGIAVSTCWEVGQLHGHGTPPAKTAAWSLSSGDSPEDDVELATQLRRVLERLLPVREALWGLVDSGYRADWFCYLRSHSVEHAAELPRDLLADLLKVPGQLLLDIYDDYPDGE